MNIQHEVNNEKGSFFINDSNNRVAELTYTIRDGNKMAAEHTEVEKSMRNKRVGHKLVDVAVAYARAHQMKIIPICPFVKDVFNKNESFHDVLDS